MPPLNSFPQHIIQGCFQHGGVPVSGFLGGDDGHFTGVLEEPGEEGRAQADGDGDVEGVGGLAGELRVFAEGVDNLVDAVVFDTEGDVGFFAVEHEEDFGSVVVEVEVVLWGNAGGVLFLVFFGEQFSFFVLFFPGDEYLGHPVNAEGQDFFLFFGVANQVVPVVLPDGGIWGYDIFFSVVAKGLLLVRVIAEVAEDDLFVSFRGFLDGLDDQEDLVVFGLHQFGYENAGFQGVLLEGRRQFHQAVNHLFALFRGQELGGGNGVDQNLKFRG